MIKSEIWVQPIFSATLFAVIRYYVRSQWLLTQVHCLKFKVCNGAVDQASGVQGYSWVRWRVNSVLTVRDVSASSHFWSRLRLGLIQDECFTVGNPVN